MLSTREENGIRRLLQRLPGWQERAAGAELARLSGGITNTNYRVDIGKESFVLRLGGRSAPQLGINRQHEHAAAQMAAQAGVGPEVIYSDPEADILITRFIKGKALTPRVAARPEYLQRIMATLRQFHNGPAISGYFSPFDTVRAYHRLALRKRVVFLPFAQQALELMKRIESVLGPPRRPLPCHNDLLAANFIAEGQHIRIIDWEYAAMGDPYFDLGNFAVNQSLGEAREKLLLQAYWGTVRSEDLARLRLMRLASDLREAFWGFLQSGISTIRFDYRGYAEKHLLRFLKHAESPRIARIMECRAPVGS